jgi:integrase
LLRCALTTFGFLLKMPKVANQQQWLIGADQGVAAMRDRLSRGEKPNVRRKYRSPDEARRLIDAAATVGRNGERDKLLLALMYRHGLRVSEVIDLRWTDFDLDAPRERRFWVRRLKGSKGTTHTLEPDTARALRRARDGSDGQYVFRSERGGPLSVDAVQVIVARAGTVAGLRVKCHPHMLRHACGFYLADQGTDTRLIQDYLGHKDIKSTVIYTETSQRRLSGVRVR